MRVSGWLFLLEQILSALCLLLSVSRILGAPMRATPRVLVCGTMGGLACAPALLSGSVWVRLTLLPVMTVLPLIAFPSLFPSMLRPLPGVTLLALLTAIGWQRLMDSLGLPGVLGLPLTCLVVLGLPHFTPHAAPPRHAVLTITLAGRTLRVDALQDSGNLLRDPVNGLPVIVLSHEALSRWMPPPSVDALRPGMRLMSARTAAGPALLILIRPDDVCLGRRPVRAMLAFSPASAAACPALVPACLFSPISHPVIGG